MPRHPIADDSRELPDLQSESAIFPRRDAKGILIQSNLNAVITRIESAIDSRLREKIKLRAELSIEKKCQARIEEIVDLAIDQSRSRLLEMVSLQIQGPAQPCSKIVLKSSRGQRVVEPVKKVLNLERLDCANRSAETEREKTLHLRHR